MLGGSLISAPDAAEFERLRHALAVAQQLIAAMRVAGEQQEAMIETLSPLRTLLEEAERECKRVARDNVVLTAENEAKTADLRRLQKSIDPDEIKLRIMYAVEEAIAEKTAELATERAEIVSLHERISELERSKKRLREALARLSDAT